MRNAYRISVGKPGEKSVVIPKQMGRLYIKKIVNRIREYGLNLLDLGWIQLETLVNTEYTKGWDKLKYLDPQESLFCMESVTFYPKQEGKA